VLIYLFRNERTDNRALTIDVTGRNIPLVTSSTVWLFVEAITWNSVRVGQFLCAPVANAAPVEAPKRYRAA
jgi:hypothetical protein